MRVDIAITSIGIALGKTLMLPPDDCHQHVSVDFFSPFPSSFSGVLIMGLLRQLSLSVRYGVYI